MSKIDDLCSTVARIEQKVDDFKPTVAAILKQVDEHEVNLNGDKTCEGLNEWRRNFYKRHALISALVPSSIIIGWELFKYKLTGKW